MKSVCFFPLSQGEWATVDLVDAALVGEHKWTLREWKGKKYAYRRGGQRLHRLLTGALQGQEPDHIDGDGLNNRRSNLRLGTHAHNGMNLKKWASETSSQFKGVSRRPQGDWRAYITKDRKQIHLGLWHTEEHAARAYDVAARSLFGVYAKTNFTSRN